MKEANGRADKHILNTYSSILHMADQFFLATVFILMALHHCGWPRPLLYYRLEYLTNQLSVVKAKYLNCIDEFGSSYINDWWK